MNSLDTKQKNIYCVVAAERDISIGSSSPPVSFADIKVKFHLFAEYFSPSQGECPKGEGVVSEPPLVGLGGKKSLQSLFPEFIKTSPRFFAEVNLCAVLPCIRIGNATNQGYLFK